MAEQPKNPSTSEAKTEEKETTPEVKTKVETSKVDETTLGEALGTKADAGEPKMIPEADVIGMRKSIKNLNKELKLLKESKAEGATKTEIGDQLAKLKAKWPDNSEFIDEFSQAILGSVKTIDDDELDEKISSKVKTEKEAIDPKKLDAIFDEHYDKTLEAMPEYKDIANKAVIKALALNPANANKTFGKILEEAFGHLVTGKKTLEKTKPGGGKDATEIDYNRAAKDTKYFAEIMADPTLKKEYNSNLEKRLKL